MDKKLLTSFMVLGIAEGTTISYTYSQVDENGNFIKRNTKDSFLVTDEDILGHIYAIQNYIRSNRLN